MSRNRPKIKRHETPIVAKPKSSEDDYCTSRQQCPFSSVAWWLDGVVGSVGQHDEPGLAPPAHAIGAYQSTPIEETKAWAAYQDAIKKSAPQRVAAGLNPRPRR